MDKAFEGEYENVKNMERKHSIIGIELIERLVNKEEKLLVLEKQSENVSILKDTITTFQY